VSESLGMDAECRSWWTSSWFSHNACVRANFFSANSISTWRKRSATDDGIDDIGGKSSSLLSLIVSRSGVDAILDGGDIVPFIIDLQESQQRFCIDSILFLYFSFCLSNWIFNCEQIYGNKKNKLFRYNFLFF